MTPTRARELAKIARHLSAKINLILYNTVEGLEWSRPSRARQEEFQSILREPRHLGKLLQPQKLEPLREPRRASLFTISALQIGQCGTVSNELVLAADFCVWRLFRDERMTRIRPRSAFSLSQYNGIPTTRIRMAQTMITDSTFPNSAWVNWSICAPAMAKCSKFASHLKVFFFVPVLNF